jgi:hypothetical protein
MAGKLSLDHMQKGVCDFNHKVAQTAMIWLNAFTAMIWLKTCKRVASSISMG